MSMIKKFLIKLTLEVSDNEERTPVSPNSPNSSKTVVRVFHPPEKKHTDLKLVKIETFDIFETS